MSNPIVEKSTQVQRQKPLIHLLVSDPKGKVMSRGRSVLTVGAPTHKDGLYRWSPACGREIRMTHGSSDVCTGDVKAVSCPFCIDSDPFWVEARRQYPAETQLIDDEDAAEAAELAEVEVETQVES